MLREFEDQENQLSEMDVQVDSYREAGKEEAAARLEDQLHLIHARFQVRYCGLFESLVGLFIVYSYRSWRASLSCSNVRPTMTAG